MTIYLIRHGKSIDDVNKVMQRDDSEIIEDKIKICFLQNYFVDKNIEKIFCSNVKRAEQTAQFLFPNKNIEIIKDIYEYRRPNFLNGTSQQEGFKFWEIDHKEDKYDPNWKYDNSESFNDILKRVKKFSKYIINLDKDCVVIGHGVFFRHFLGYSLLKEKYTTNLFFNFLLKLKLDNYSLIKMNFEENHLKDFEII